jgi:hypothetical protein
MTTLLGFPDPGEKLMANIQLPNDKSVRIPLNVVKQSDQSAQSWPNGAAPFAISAHPTSLAASIVTGSGQVGFAVEASPLVQAGTSYSVTWGAPGMLGGTFVFDIVADPNALQINADSNQADWTFTQQGIPTNPGP